jgi:uncharacterized LabA/DUF88 family protein
MDSYIYIDWANLHQWAKNWWGLHYQKFRQRLLDKYHARQIFLFLWYIKWKESLYSQLSQRWYTLIFKETLEINGKVKGNCDAELVVKAVENYYEQPATQSVLVTWDGDFACLVDFFVSKQHAVTILVPNRLYCSYLLKKRNAPLVLLEEQKHKFQ